MGKICKRFRQHSFVIIVCCFQCLKPHCIYEAELPAAGSSSTKAFKVSYLGCRCSSVYVLCIMVTVPWKISNDRFASMHGCRLVQQLGQSLLIRHCGVDMQQVVFYMNTLVTKQVNLTCLSVNGRIHYPLILHFSKQPFSYRNCFVSHLAQIIIIITVVKQRLLLKCFLTANHLGCELYLIYLVTY